LSTRESISGDSMPDVGIELLPHAAGLPGLEVMTSGAAGYDLRAAVSQDLVLEPGKVRLVPTGLRLEIPHGYEAQVRPRSGLALRAQVGVLNSPGTIDSDYRGEVQVVLFNFGDEPFRIARGDRVAQLVFARVYHPRIEARALSETPRAAGGFGHTGSC
jgi:dUTP pyrophosphatase